MTISTKIRKRLEQPNGLTQEALEPLAAEYAQIANDVNSRLAECIAFLRKGLRSEALQRATMKPGVLEMAAELDFPELEEWIEILQFCDIEPPQLVDRDAAAQLHEAFIEEQPLEELLKQHRRLAIAKAPLAWRLKVLRQIASVDSMNPVWHDDIRQWETVRLKQITSDVGKLRSDPHATEDLRQLSEELHSRWLVEPPSELKQKVMSECNRRAYEAQVGHLKDIASALHEAHLASDEEAGKAALADWTQSLPLLTQPPPRELVDDTAPAIEWVEERMRESVSIERHTQLSSKLEQLLQSTSSNEGQLTRAYHDVIGLDLGIDSLLDNRFRTRLSEIQQSTQRRLVISVVGIVAAALALMVGGGLWYWNHNYRLAVNNTTSQLQSLIASESYGEAESILTTLDNQAPSVAKAPEIASMRSSLLAKQEEERSRAERVAALIAEADAEDPESIDSNRLATAEKEAKTPREKQDTSRIRTKLEQYQQRLANRDFEQLRNELQGLEAQLEQLQKQAMSEVSEADLEKLITQIKSLLQKYPKATVQASKIVELSSQRATAARETLRKQRREMEQRQVFMVGIRSATTVQEHAIQLQKYVDALPTDSMSLEFKDALNEAAFWKSVEEWNGWCNNLALQLSNRLASDKLLTLGKTCSEVRSAIDGLPGEVWVPRYQSKMQSMEKRDEILDTLAQELTDSVIVDLYTLRKPSDSNPIERAFVQYESSAEILSDLKRVSERTRSTIPVVSDATGGVSNTEFIGKLEILEEPRQSIRILIRDLKSKKAAILTDWENQILALLGQIAQYPNVDGKIKEILLARVMTAGREGSILMKEAFSDLQESLFRTSEKRNRWYGLGTYQEGIDPELIKLFQKARENLDVKRKEESTQLQSLSKAKVVWVGAILRDGKGSVSPSLYRQDVPDGVLYTVVSDAARRSVGKLVRVGAVREKSGVLQASSETLLPGRPLFWMRGETSNR
jgi:hypothetical protein